MLAGAAGTAATLAAGGLSAGVAPLEFHRAVHAAQASYPIGVFFTHRREAPRFRVIVISHKHLLVI
jgi:hypothetical protein